MGVARGNERCVQIFFLERLKGDHLEDLGVYGRIILKFILRKYVICPNPDLNRVPPTDIDRIQYCIIHHLKVNLFVNSVLC